MPLGSEFQQQVVMLSGLFFFWAIHRGRSKAELEDRICMASFRASLNADYDRAVNGTLAVCLPFIAAALYVHLGQPTQIMRILTIDVGAVLAVSASVGTLLIGAIRYGFHPTASDS